MTGARIRYDAPPEHEFRCGDLHLKGGETATVPEADAALLVERHPEIKHVRAAKPPAKQRKAKA